MPTSALMHFFSNDQLQRQIGKRR